MTMPQLMPYGSWKSPISSDLIASETIGLEQVFLDGDDIYWIESRPAEGGRYVIVRRSANGITTDRTPAPFNARTRVHEYGGGAYAILNGSIYFSNYADQRLYSQKPASSPIAITPVGDLRYADGAIDYRHGRIICVREDHTVSEREAINTLMSIDLEGKLTSKVLVEGNDFYSSPRLSPNESQLAWLTWNHPNMPWDGTELWVSEFNEDGSLGRSELVAGGDGESIFQPEWSPDGVLHFVSDRTGWWNIYRWRNRHIEALTEREAEFGRPQWRFRLSTYAFESANRIICAYTSKGTWKMASLNTSTLEIDPINIPYTEISDVRASPGRVIFIAGSPTEPTSIVKLNLASKQIEVLRRSNSVAVDEGYLSKPQAIEYPTSHGLTAHAFYYRPHNKDQVAPPGERPPLLVMSHGGPTSAASSGLNFAIQYWTSRGIAIIDVNYGGSTGYGREYRERLNDQWGIVDVDDCVNGARYLVDRGEVDGNRLIIRGGSAGGYTTLCALTFRNIFKAGASYYGISDLEALAKETHKFESRYLDRLVGLYPERIDLYRKRSPIYFTDRLSCPVIFFQGLEDKIVPPNQAETMFKALLIKGLPVSYIPFQGEQHGFRRAENIKKALDSELYFYSRVFNFRLADPVEPVPIENL